MFAVIFRAKTGQQDQDYIDTVNKMRELAFEKYGCLDFIAVTEGGEEIAISYWPSEQAILAWKSDPEHHQAQVLGREKWYQAYSVEIVEIKRKYSFEQKS